MIKKQQEGALARLPLNTVLIVLCIRPNPPYKFMNGRHERYLSCLSNRHCSKRYIGVNGQ